MKLMITYQNIVYCFWWEGEVLFYKKSFNGGLNWELDRIEVTEAIQSQLEDLGFVFDLVNKTVHHPEVPNE